MATSHSGKPVLTPSLTPSLLYGQENVKIPHKIDIAFAEQTAPPAPPDLGASAIELYLDSDITTGAVIATNAKPDDIIRQRISDIEHVLNLNHGRIGLDLDWDIEGEDFGCVSMDEE